jgi:hypothetical protein
MKRLRMEIEVNRRDRNVERATVHIIIVKQITKKMKIERYSVITLQIGYFSIEFAFENKTNQSKCNLSVF